MSIPLLKDLEELVQANIITQDTAEKITSYYQSKGESSPNKFGAVLGILGSILVGSGIVLVVAHNWDNLNRLIKTILSFLPLVLGQALCIYTILKRKGNVVWQESSAVILFFGVAAAIALVSQIYHISGDLETFLLTWLLLTFPLIYLLSSSLLALLFIAVSTWYGCVTGYSNIFSSSRAPIPWWYLILILLIVPHYYRYLKNKPGSNFFHLLNWFLAISITIMLGAFSTHQYPGTWLQEGYMALFAVYYLLGHSSLFRDNKLFANPFLIIGLLGTICILMFDSGYWYWDYHTSEAVGILAPPFSIIELLLLIATCLLMIKNYRDYKGQFDPVPWSPFLFILAIISSYNAPSLTTFIINICVLAIGLYYIRKGSLQNHFGILNFGLLIIAVLTVLRFFDDNIPFIWRGIFFLAAGIGFIAANYLLLKKRKAIIQKTNP